MAVDQYESRESLIRRGVWKGDLYKTVDVNKGSRGWLWKTLVLDDDQEVKELMPVPILTEGSEDPTSAIVQSANRPRDNLIRRLTPVATKAHPLSQKQIGDMRDKGELEGQKVVEGDEDDEDGMSVSEKLEIIDLDLSRLMLDKIFQEPLVHARMKQIMYNFLMRKGASSPSSYKQGYHEILGIIFLQLDEARRNNEGGNNDNSNNNNDDDDGDAVMMNQVLCIFEKIMKQMVGVFYNETRLIKWDSDVFQPILNNSCPELYKLIYSNQHHHTNIIWLIRWTRLLFIRELPRDYTLIIWDHILTFTYPLDTLIACIIVTLLVNNYQNLMEKIEDHNDIVEFMLHYSLNSSSMIDCVELCKMSGNLCELWYLQDFTAMKLVADSFLKIRFNVENKTTPKAVKIDPNRKRLEDRLRKRVKQTLLTKETK